MMMASQVARAGFWPVKTPTMSMNRAPTARMTSGSDRCKLARIVSAVMFNHVLSSFHRQRNIVRRLQCSGIVVDQKVDRRRRGIKDRSRIDTEEDGQHDQRIENDLLAAGQIEQCLQAFLVERAEDHPAIEPESVGCRQDDAP